MPRPCAADHPPSPDLCHLCKLAATRPDYARLWGEVAWSGPCRHRGEEVGREQCPSCNGHVQIKLFACACHGRCTVEKPVPSGTRTCQGCPDYFPLPPAPHVEAPGLTRHLLYHVYPSRAMGGEPWRWNLAELKRRLPLFGGRRVVAIAHDAGSEPPAAVREALAGEGCEFVELVNEPKLREVLTFEPLFSRVAGDVGEGDATFFAHAKGVTNHSWADPTIRAWTAAMYESCLDWWSDVQAALRDHACAGSFRRLIAGWPAHESASAWHYSGSFFWFRNRDLFRKDWRRIDRFTHGIEAYLGTHFPAEAAATLVCDHHDQGLYLYQRDQWDAVERGPLAEARWRVRLREMGPGHRIELGGGEKPKAGFVNVDQHKPADVVLDFGQESLPFEDESAIEVYTAHALEHVPDLHHVLREIVRVCRVGARVEIRVPSWLSSMAMCHGHIQTIPPQQVDHWCRTAVPYWFGGCARRLRHERTEHVPGGDFAEARRLFPHMTDDQVMRFVPGACHEIAYTLTVVPYGD